MLPETLLRKAMKSNSNYANGNELINSQLPKKKWYGYAIPGRFGLGHSLLAWARCFLWCTDHQVEMLAPRWHYLRIGPYLRREADKRSYHTLFKKDVYVHGLKRLWILGSAKRCPSDQAPQTLFDGSRTKIAVFENDTRDNGRFFQFILGRQDEVRSELLRIARPEHIPAQSAQEPFIGIHVRRGDFTRVSDPAALKKTGNVQLPVEWYKDILLSIRERASSALPARVFSDGSAESLRCLLQLPNVSFVESRSALHDIFALSDASVLISSPSGFSMWAAYLGQVPRVCFPNQRRHRVLAPHNTTDLEPECEAGKDVPLPFVEQFMNFIRVPKR